MPLRLLIYRALRADELCDGGESGGDQCERAKDVHCVDCGCAWEPDDTSVTGACPQCGGWNIQALRCEGCPVDEIARIRECSRAGGLFNRAIDLDFDVSNFSVSWAEVLAEDVRALQILRSERSKREYEVRKQQYEESQRQARR